MIYGCDCRLLKVFAQNVKESLSLFALSEKIDINVARMVIKDDSTMHDLLIIIDSRNTTNLLYIVYYYYF